MSYEFDDLKARYREEVNDGDTGGCGCHSSVMIDTSWSSIRVALIMVLAVIWFYLLNVELRSRDEEEDR